MYEVHLQLTEQLFNKAKLRAAEAGFASLDEYIIDVVAEDAATETLDLDERFTPKVVGHLEGMLEEIKAGGKTYSEEELDKHLLEKARIWRESHPS